ncbi:UNVERIFIED_CONTAM: hypothetical protein K2H54_020596 [Gekko kuhli]
MQCPIYFSKAERMTVCFPHHTYGHTTIPLHLKNPFMCSGAIQAQEGGKSFFFFFTLIEDSMLRISGKHHLAHPLGEMQRYVGWVHAHTCRLKWGYSKNKRTNYVVGRRLFP